MRERALMPRYVSPSRPRLSAPRTVRFMMLLPVTTRPRSTYNLEGANLLSEPSSIAGLPRPVSHVTTYTADIHYLDHTFCSTGTFVHCPLHSVIYAVHRRRSTGKSIRCPAESEKRADRTPLPRAEPSWPVHPCPSKSPPRLETLVVYGAKGRLSGGSRSGGRILPAHTHPRTCVDTCEADSVHARATKSKYSSFTPSSRRSTPQ